MCTRLDIPISFFYSHIHVYYDFHVDISALANHVQQGNVNAVYAVYLGVGSVIGAQVGAYVSRRFSIRSLSFVFAAMLILASVNMILKYA
jgi:uncharacterized membrane protein YfcA